jgi:hypothetical protein
MVTDPLGKRAKRRELAAIRRRSLLLGPPPRASGIHITIMGVNFKEFRGSPGKN